VFKRKQREEGVRTKIIDVVKARIYREGKIKREKESEKKTRE
jgi:hypothetical protein